MKKTSLTISYDAEKLSAIKTYMAKKDADLQSEIDDVMQKLYEKHVPPAVREYIENRADDTAELAKPKRPQRPALTTHTDSAPT